MSTYCLSLPSAGLPDDALQEKSLLGVLGLLSGAPGGCGARKEYAQARLRMESSNFGAPTHEKKKSPQIRGAKKIRVAAKKIKHETQKREGETPKKQAEPRMRKTLAWPKTCANFFHSVCILKKLARVFGSRFGFDFGARAAGERWENGGKAARERRESGGIAAGEQRENGGRAAGERRGGKTAGDRRESGGKAAGGRRESGGETGRKRRGSDGRTAREPWESGGGTVGKRRENGGKAAGKRQEERRENGAIQGGARKPPERVPWGPRKRGIGVQEALRTTTKVPRRSTLPRTGLTV